MGKIELFLIKKVTFWLYWYKKKASKYYDIKLVSLKSFSSLRTTPKQKIIRCETKMHVGIMLEAEFGYYFIFSHTFHYNFLHDSVMKEILKVSNYTM